MPSIAGWLNQAPQETDALPPEQRAAEILAFGLRLVNGWKWREYESITGYDAREFRGAQLEECRLQGLVTMTDDGVAPTRQGLLFNDNLLERLI